MTTQTAAETTIEELAGRYGEAWNAQDLDAIMDLHADDCVFHAHAAGSPPATGKRGVHHLCPGRNITGPRKLESVLKCKPNFSQYVASYTAFQETPAVSGGHLERGIGVFANANSCL